MAKAKAKGGVITDLHGVMQDLHLLLGGQQAVFSQQLFRRYLGALKQHPQSCGGKPQFPGNQA